MLKKNTFIVQYFYLKGRTLAVAQWAVGICWSLSGGLLLVTVRYGMVHEYCVLEAAAIAAHMQ